MARYVFGADVGGTTVKIGLFTSEGKLIDSQEIPTRKEDEGSHILSDICEAIDAKLVDRKMTRDDLIGVGIGIPGPITKDGSVLGCVNLGWGIFNVEEKLSQMLGGVKVKAGNDANVAALGETWQGGGRGFEDIVLVTLGTGVGGGVILNDDIIPGAHGAAGEIGHIRVNYTEENTCGCGNHGCLEQYCSATGIARLAKIRLAQNDDDSSLRTLEANITKYGKFTPTIEETSIFIYPPHEFKSADALITNFHLPKSTLVMLVSAFSSVDIIKNAYYHAQEEKYKFFSFGDAMFLTNEEM